MTGLHFRPLSPSPLTSASPTRKPGAFQVDYSQIILDLEHELRHLAVTDALISTGHRPDEIGSDGWPRSGARKLPDPTVTLHLATRYGPLVFTSDTYDNWQSNLRAIALTLESLRTVDRLSVLQEGGQYRRFAASPFSTHINDPAISATRRNALRTLLHEAGIPLTPAEIDAILRTPDAWRETYRLAVLRAHPDTGGSHERFLRVTAAMEILRDRES